MGVPAFFRWLSRKYPSVVVDAIEEYPVDVEGVRVPVDTSKKNPNGVEFDNLYLDMNGIIHPCTHPENKPAPKDEDEMMVAIFECIDTMFSIVRPRKLLYMAIDGVAPRAKMNQQRSRRFRASKESAEKADEISRIRSEMETKGLALPPPKEKGSYFDSNCITPGTPFMDRLSKCLNYYIHERLNNDPGWRGIKVILSDANVPGEGEHKIMDFIRKQRGQLDYDPNTHHCLCGADADLIMLGLATHEPYFTIIREEFQYNQLKKCDICSQTGHEMKECRGLENIPSTEMILAPSPQKYIFVRLNVLREYLERELQMPNLPFKYEFERALDDWVFMCFFVGNDFLPHLPSLEIRENAIDRLVELYKKCVYKTGGFLTDSGDVNLERVQLIMNDLGKVEDQIFRNRQDRELMFERRNREKKIQERLQKMQEALRRGEQPMDEPMQEEQKPHDDVRLWEDGYKERYYESKFGLVAAHMHHRFKIALAYVRGLCWVLKYYYQGCASWKWYFPYHYAPFASDFVNIESLDLAFENNTQPFKPLEQLMGVFPAASSAHVPPTWAKLMFDPESPIIDFYPRDFMIDLNGKKFAWQGVALLPFVDEKRLKEALQPLYNTLSSDEIARNIRGSDRLYIGNSAESFVYVQDLMTQSQEEKEVIFKQDDTFGTVCIKKWENLYGKIVISPVKGLEPVKINQVVCVSFKDPFYKVGHKFMARRLAGVKEPPRVLKQGDDPNHRPQIGMAPSTTRAYLDRSGHRALNHNLGFNQDRNQGRAGGTYHTSSANNYNSVPFQYNDKNNFKGRDRYNNQSFNRPRQSNPNNRQQFNQRANLGGWKHMGSNQNRYLPYNPNMNLGGPRPNNNRRWNNN